jgi:hypothetical protein
MDKSLFDRIVAQLMPEMASVSDRQALVQSALFGSPVLHQIDWSGAANQFTVRLVTRLYQYDVSAITAVLQELHTQVGSSRQAEIKELIGALSATPSTVKGKKSIMLEAIGFKFLIDIGNWAATELQERWRLKRNEKELDLQNLSESNLVENVQPVLDDISKELDEAQVRHHMEMIEKRRGLIRDWEKAKATDQRAMNLGQMQLAVLEARETDFNDKIKKTLREIEADLKAMGFTLEKE